MAERRGGGSLAEYRRKRDFSRTPEPSGDGDRGRGAAGARSTGRGRRFVVQKHAASRLHYDFRLEADGVLLSWAVPKGPSLDPEDRRLAMRTEDHPLPYADFEGVIPEEEYGGGTVMVWDRGYWVPDEEPAAGLRAGKLRFRLEGEKLRGDWTLARMGGRTSDEDRESWLLIKRRDGEAAGPDAPPVTDARPLSVLSGRDLEAIAADRERLWTREGEAAPGGGEPASAPPPPGDPSDLEGAREARLPEAADVQLATLVSEPPEGDEWLHEIKFDGYRMLARVETGRARLLTRGGKDWTARFPDVSEASASLAAETALVDGEAVVLDPRGISDFQALQNAMGERREDLVFYAFDLLHLDGHDLAGVPLEERKRTLRLLLAASDAGPTLRYSDHVRGRGTAFFREACESGLEGIVSKRADAGYRQGRSREWLKTKCVLRQEFVVAGFTEPSGSRVGLGALLLGVRDEAGALLYAGKVGTGFTHEELGRLRERLSRLERKSSPLADPPRGADARGVHWVRPEVVVEVAFTEWTGDGRIRHPSYRGVREDRSPETVVREVSSGAGATAAPAGEEDAGDDGPAGASGGESRSPAESIAAGAMADDGGVAVERVGDELRVAGIRISSPEKVLYPEQGVTKEGLVRHWARVADLALPHMASRPLTLLRCPSGAHEQCFYQKHAAAHVPDVVARVPVEERDGTELYMAVEDAPSLLALVQLGVLEFHPWNARTDRLDRPDRLVFDLDPGEDVAWEEVREGALALRDVLDALGLRSFPRTTGGAGLHLVAPLVRRNDWDTAGGFAKGVAERLAREAPERFVSSVSKSRRGGRIYIDWLRNGYNATAIASYSPRARPGAPVAVPLSWEELEGAEERPRWTVTDLPGRLERLPGDPWEAYGELRQSVTKAMEEALGTP